MLVNDKGTNIKCNAGTIVQLKRLFSNGDKIELRIPMSVKEVYLPENGIAYERGPQVYSLSIAAKTVINGTNTDDTVSFNSTYKMPNSAWNCSVRKIH